MFKMSAFGLNTSSQVCWPLVNYQSATAPCCTTQLHDMRDLPLPVIPESVAKHHSLLVLISFKSEVCLLQYQFEIFTS